MWKRVLLLTLAMAALLLWYRSVEMEPEVAPDSSVDVSEAASRLPGLSVIENNPRSEGYDRSSFKHWSDPDGNGCDTRNDILARDMSEIDTTDGCMVISGTLDDPYTGDMVAWTKSGGGVDIDHIIPLKRAWITGASEWDDSQREEFANDPENLLAVDAGQNRSKSDQGPETWMVPENPGYRCEYAARYVGVADKYDLSITARDYDVLDQTLKECA